MTYRFSELSFMKSELGAEQIEGGTYFAVFSEHAERIELCLFDEAGEKQLATLDLPKREGGIWAGFVPDTPPGVIYGYRAHGPYDPEKGLRFNPNKLLLDPYAKEIHGTLKWDDALYGYTIGDSGEDLSFDERDSAEFMPKSRVPDQGFDWGSDQPLRRPWADTVIYECHARGLTMLNEKISDKEKGTFAGLCADPVIEHLQALGITAVELLPCHYFIDDRHLLEKGLTNYWGYQTLGFFAPEPRFLKGQSISEFKKMVKRFHEAGIEVIMDVVFNHTAEGNEKGPTLSYRGLDNSSYYNLSTEKPRHSFDHTGTGNTLNISHPMVLRMVLDSLRYWTQFMHVDGFRFDLASTLGREPDGFDRNGGFFDAIRQDPVLSSVKLIAEPWDIGAGGYQVGGFPTPFREWNDKFRDTVRSFWRGDKALLPSLSERLVGSPIQFNHSNRTASTSINFLTAHDGFTLSDVVSYSDKHNTANGEEGRDGHDNNQSDNMGFEGETDDPRISAFRTQRRKNLMATLFLAQGVPMMLGGDELANTQGGNNNSYCQDNEIGWTKWKAIEQSFVEFCQKLISFRKLHPALRQEQFFVGDDMAKPVVLWFQANGQRMNEEAWNQADRQILWVCVKQPETADLDCDCVLYVLNSGAEILCALPNIDGFDNWQLVISTAEAAPSVSDLPAGQEFTIPAQSVLVFLPS